MKKNKDPFEGIFDSLQDKTLPTNEQKERMLHHILMESRFQDITLWEKVDNWITIYPWRFAFGAAAAQTAACTLIFGTKYTNLFLSFFGG
jgi:hypothetical protein